MRLLVVRHGATANNSEARITGQLNAPLNDLGKLQAQALGQRLSDTLLTAIISSDLLRARATAKAIAALHQPEPMPIIEEPDLREIAMGVWEGERLADVAAREPELVAAWRADPEHVAPPGGETVTQLHARIVPALDRWQARYPDPDQMVVWVTHGGVIGVLLCHLLGMEMKRRDQFERANTAITEIALGKSYARLVRLNDTAHLAALATVGANAERFQVF